MIYVSVNTFSVSLSTHYFFMRHVWTKVDKLGYSKYAYYNNLHIRTYVYNVTLVTILYSWENDMLKY